MARSVTDRKLRSLHSQIVRMQNRWAFEIRFSDTHVRWEGHLRGFQMPYRVRIHWNHKQLLTPYVQLVDPPLTPREGVGFDKIPHLMRDITNPEQSGLCLYDPEGNEWDATMLIADTTIPWAADWLKHYELWHYDGTWRGKSVGPEFAA